MLKFWHNMEANEGLMHIKFAAPCLVNLILEAENRQKVDKFELI